jgi:hypothetical protein
MPLLPQRFNRRQPPAAPILLPGFAAAVLVLVVAVVVIARTDSGLADAGTIALLLVFAGLMMGAIGRRLREQEPDATEDRPRYENRP